MDLKAVLDLLQDLESKGHLNPSRVISDFGFEKVMEVLSSIETARRYNIPEQYYLTFLNDLGKTTLSESREAVETPREVDQNCVFLSPDLFSALKRLSKDSEIKLSTRDIALLSGCDPNNVGVARKIASFMEAFYDFELSNDPTRPARTRTKVFSVNLNSDVCYDVLNDFLSSKKEDSWSKRFPVILNDYLMGSESGFVFSQASRNWELPSDLVSKFISIFKKNYKVALCLDKAPDVSAIERSPLNMYLLDRALKQSFPSTDLHEMIEGLATPYMTVDHRKDICVYVREEMANMSVSSDGGDNFSKLDSNLSGFTYLIAYSIASAIISEGGLPQPF